MGRPTVKQGSPRFQVVLFAQPCIHSAQRPLYTENSIVELSVYLLIDSGLTVDIHITMLRVIGSSVLWGYTGVLTLKTVHRVMNTLSRLFPLFWEIL